jgi:hypothetical protein
MRRTAATGEQLVQSRGAVVPVLNYGNIPTTSEYSNLCRLIVPLSFWTHLGSSKSFFLPCFCRPVVLFFFLKGVHVTAAGCWMEVFLGNSRCQLVAPI